MATTIVTKNGSGAPTASDLVAGELAVDLTNGRLYTTDLDSGGTVLELGTNPASDVTFGDNTKAIFGAGSDLQIFHDASDSYIKDEGTGNLYLTTNGSTMNLQAGSDNMVKIYKDAQVEIFHDASVKLATTATGIDVTGTVTADGLTVDGSPVRFVSTAPMLNFMESGDTDSNHRLRQNAGNFVIQKLSDDEGTATDRLLIDGGTGDISFYEDTGTTAKFFWDASAESLGIGTSSPASELHVKSSGTSSDTLTIENSTGNGSWRVKEGSSSNALLQGYNASNSETIRLDPTSDTFFNGGNVGIGTSSPDTLLHLSDTAGGAVIRLERNDTSIVSTDVYGEIQFEGQDSSAGSAAGIRGKILGVAEGATGEMALAFQTAGGYGASTERMRIDASGNLLVGGTSYEQAGSIGFKGTGEYSSILSSGAGGEIYAGGAIALVSNGYQISVTTGNAQTYKWHNGTTRSMTLDSSGNLLVGTTTAEARLTVKSSGSSSSTNAINVDNSSGTELFYVRDDGALRTGSAAVSPYNNTAAVTANLFVNTDGTLLRATSSRRYKKDIVDARFGLSDLLNLRPVNYKGINSEVDGDIVYGGLIAEEVHDAGLTEFVEYNKENQPDALRYQHMVSLCIKAIQEQQATIEALTARIAALES